MNSEIQRLEGQLRHHFPGDGVEVALERDEVTLTLPRTELFEGLRRLRDEGVFAFEQLIDLCGVDYSAYGAGDSADEQEGRWQGPRFAVVYHLLSLSHNRRLRVRSFLDDEMPLVDSVVPIWSAANWFEREAFDLYGIIFDGHPDLRRILTDYGFVGHPFRKDFPLIGTVEMRYDEDLGRVVYEPVSIEPRVTVPRTIRDDHRYAGRTDEEGAS
jgi:NADH-quinone oxidoreductase subunit C